MAPAPGGMAGNGHAVAGQRRVKGARTPPLMPELFDAGGDEPEADRVDGPTCGKLWAPVYGWFTRAFDIADLNR
jgi:hypothetical protein